MVIISGFLSFTANNIPELSDFMLFQSMFKVFYFFQVQFKFYNDEVTEIFIEFNSCNKTVTWECSETVAIEILPDFIKTVVFHHVGLLWMIETKE